MFAVISLVVLLGVQSPVVAQSASSSSSPLSVYTRYPAQVVEAGKTVTIDLTLKNNGKDPLIVKLNANNVPKGWKASFRGLGRIVKAVYVEPDQSASVSLRLEQPASVKSGTYTIQVVATSGEVRAELPIELTVKSKLPPKLRFNVELPVLRGSPTTNFRFDGTLYNDGDQDLTVNLTADAPEGFQVTFKPSYGSQEVTSLPVKAGDSKRLTIEVTVPHQIAAGRYPIRVRAVGGSAQATVDLAVEVTGQPQLSVTTTGGRLSANAYIGKETPVKIIVQNSGTAAAHNVSLYASEPAGWKVNFDPKQIPEIPAGKQVQVTAKIRPADKAVAGDYMVTIRANADGGVSDSTDFRITVLTSTLWGVVGIALIAIAVLIVGLAVIRFGRR